MPVFHFLNVKDGDCSIIQHGSEHVSVVDVCNANLPESKSSQASATDLLEQFLLAKAESSGNHNQKAHPVNPIDYLKSFGISSVFRFVVTHPDMDHLDGFKDFAFTFRPANIWDTDNKAEKEFEKNGRYNEDDWQLYKGIRDANPQDDPRRMTLYSGDSGPFRTEDWQGQPGGDGLHVLAPTRELVRKANETGDYHLSSYVILYATQGGRILLSGDSHDESWDHILARHADKVADVDLLIAPHHGRSSGRKYDFLNVTRPKLTFFGNAPSEHLAYSAWNYRGLPYITNNQANCMVVDAGTKPMKVFVTNETFARQQNRFTYYDPTKKAWFLQDIA